VILTNPIDKSEELLAIDLNQLLKGSKKESILKVLLNKLGL
jgi:hypothetical protein